MTKATIRPRVGKNGGISYRVMWRHEGRLKSASFDNEKAAKRFENEIERYGSDHALAILDRRTDRDESIPLLREMTAQHVALLTGITEGTRSGYAREAERSFLPLLGELPVDTVTRDDVARWVVWYGQQPARRGGGAIAPKTIKNAHALLCAVFDSAIHAGHRQANPATKMRLPAVEKREHHYLTVEQFVRLVDEMGPGRDLFVATAGATGMRWGEITALPWKHVNLDDGHPTVLVRQAWKKANGRRVLGVPKSARSRRTIGLPPVIADQVRTLQRPADGDELVFGRGGAPIKNSWFMERHFKPALERAGIPSTFRFHDLRHSFASWLLNAGTPIWDVSAAMGHASPSTTTQVYGHLVEDMHERNAVAIARVLSAQPFVGNDEGRAIEDVMKGEILPLLDGDPDED